jgi:hypothetical protein
MEKRKQEGVDDQAEGSEGRHGWVKRTDSCQTSADDQDGVASPWAEA